MNLEARSREPGYWGAVALVQLGLGANTRALDALEQAIYDRRGDGVDDLVHHSDRGTQYLSMRYSERLADAGIAPSVGSRGDSYDNAMAESIIPRIASAAMMPNSARIID